MDKDSKNKHAVALGRRGGIARRRNISSEERQAIARRANRARWYQTCPGCGQDHRRGQPCACGHPI